MSDSIFLSGVSEDPRSQKEKEKDFQHHEISSAVPLNWDRDSSNAPVYSVRDQDGSGSCVAQSSAKALETLNGAVISAHPIYSRRNNKPGIGMYLQDAGDIVKNLGTTTEDLDPSQQMSEYQMNAPVTVSTPITKPGYAFPNVQNIDEISEAIELHKHCEITLGFDMDEYSTQKKPMYNGKTANVYHDICGIYYFKDQAGEKCILADESWGPNTIRRRILTESYLKARGTGAMYFFDGGDKPRYTFKNILTFGMTNNTDVKYLQDILKYEKLFPAAVLSTGNYFQVTAQAVLAFQRKYSVAPDQELAPLGGKRVGPKTLAKLNELYGY